MADKMTIDDLQRWISAKSKLAAAQKSEQQYAFNQVWRYIDDNRPALEAGMRRALKCKVQKYEWNENMPAKRFDTYYQAYPLKLNGEYAGFYCYPGDTAEEAKGKLIKALNEIGLTAEFEEASDEVL